MRSALPIQILGLPPLVKPYTRECSRKRPSTLRTRTRPPVTARPVRTAQMPRTHKSTGTPAAAARYRASMVASSTIELTLKWIPAGRPARWWSTSASMAAIRPSRMECGATSIRW